ncbi:methionyl-tRNA formyltransferase, putative [Eimeria necatrix]|uniref:Methionyl-tRNA formyltransferase, putative n=1 Tax=Eimeria necatrix TaxID=51315 RepID=U6MJ99_9EIME|nr:methionyl-tRNA formyltransferase, putative [Eimeria necatrix]CDJ64091.1 methionyl-tRNA formyltransferase, putative [Eimeria necatrix]
MSKSLVAATSGAVAACASTLIVFPLDTLLVHHQAAATKQPAKLLQQQQHQHRSALQALIDVLQELLQQEDAATATPTTYASTYSNKSSNSSNSSNSGSTSKDKAGQLINRISRLYSGLGIKLAEQIIRNFVYFYLYQALKSRAAKAGGLRIRGGTLLLAVFAALGTQLLTAPLDVSSTHAQLCRQPLRTIFMRILKTEGPFGFYRGFGASLCLCLNPAITNATFDSLKLWLQMVNLLRARSVMDPITDEDIPVERIGVLLQARLLERSASLHDDFNDSQQQQRALVSGDTDVPAAPSRKGDLPLDPRQESPSSINEIQRKGSIEQHLQLQQQQHTTVPRAVSVQSALDKEIEAQLIASVPASACLCDDTMRKPASFCLSECSEAGGLCICGSSEEGSPPHSAYRRNPKARDIPHLLDEEAEGGVVAVLVSALMQEGFGGLYRGLGLQLLKTILAASILFLIKEKIQNQTAQTFARIERLFLNNQK